MFFVVLVLVFRSCWEIFVCGTGLFHSSCQPDTTVMVDWVSKGQIPAFAATGPCVSGLETSTLNFREAS